MGKRASYYWNGSGGCGEVFKIALPLIISTSAYTIQMFIDRVFLMWYSSDAMAAAMFSGMTDFTIFSLFLGTALYVNAFVAQYDGARRAHREAAVQADFLLMPRFANLLRNFSTRPPRLSMLFCVPV